MILNVITISWEWLVLGPFLLCLFLSLIGGKTEFNYASILLYVITVIMGIIVAIVYIIKGIIWLIENINIE